MRRGNCKLNTESLPKEDKDHEPEERKTNDRI